MSPSESSESRMDGDSDRVMPGSNPIGGASDHMARNPAAANLSGGTKEVLGSNPVTSVTPTNKMIACMQIV